MGPFVTFQLKTKKPYGKNEIYWEKVISPEFLSNGNWYLKICAIYFVNVQHKTPETINNGAINFSLTTNLTRQRYLWYSKFPGEKDNLPIEFFSVNLDQLKNDITYAQFSGNCHPITSIENRLCITCENLSDKKYKLSDFEFDTSVLVNLFRREY